jgi:hypothetical protein
VEVLQLPKPEGIAKVDTRDSSYARHVIRKPEEAAVPLWLEEDVIVILTVSIPA